MGGKDKFLINFNSLFYVNDYYAERIDSLKLIDFKVSKYEYVITNYKDGLPPQGYFESLRLNDNLVVLKLVE